MNIFRSTRSRWYLLAAIGVVAAVAVLVISLVGSRDGEAADKLEKEQARDKALAAAKMIIPEANDTTEMPEYDSSDGYGFAVNDEDGNMVAGIVADRISGEIVLMVDIRAESYDDISGEVNVSIDEATKMAEEFFSSRGVDISEYGLEQDPLHAIALNDSDKANPIPIYQYDFSYRIQKDGIFVDDFNNGGGYCSISISPEDGKILTFILPRNDLSIKDRSIAEFNIGKEEAIRIAVDNAPMAEGRGQIPVLRDEELELRYMIDGSTLVPYWKIGTAIYEGKTGVSGYNILVNATDGSVIGVETLL
jgi:hypothetical protein